MRRFALMRDLIIDCFAGAAGALLEGIRAAIGPGSGRGDQPRPPRPRDAPDQPPGHASLGRGRVARRSAEDLRRPGASACSGCHRIAGTSARRRAASHARRRSEVSLGRPAVGEEPAAVAAAARRGPRKCRGVPGLGPAARGRQAVPTVRRGATFREFVRAFEACGYVVEWRELLRASDYGARPSAKRLFLIARRDGKPIVCGPSRRTGTRRRRRCAPAGSSPGGTAAEIIDLVASVPVDLRHEEQIRATWGIGRSGRSPTRPWPGSPRARCATWSRPRNHSWSGINHRRQRGRRDAGSTSRCRRDAPRRRPLVTPFVSYAQQGGANRDIADPLTRSQPARRTTTRSSRRSSPASTRGRSDARLTSRSTPSPRNASETHGGGAAPLGLVSGILVPRYGERPARSRGPGPSRSRRRSSSDRQTRAAWRHPPDTPVRRIGRLGRGGSPSAPSRRAAPVKAGWSRPSWRSTLRAPTRASQPRASTSRFRR